MKFTYLISSFFVIFGCNSDNNHIKEKPIDSVKIENTPSVEIFEDSLLPSHNNQIKLEKKALRDSILTNTEYMDFDEVRINGKLPLITDSLTLYGLLGKPTKIEKPDFDDVCVSFYSNRDYKYLHYGKFTKFELYGDTIAPALFEFASNPKLFLTYRGLVLNASTDIAEIEKKFPKAVKFKSQMDVYKVGKLTSIYLRTKNRNDLDDSWILFFEKGKLVRIDYFMPC